jgi:pimeloyl-ACP methyl ester carboxylesterase
VQQLTAALGITRFATMGASGGGPHALACAALLPQQVSGVATLASLAPFGAAGLDFFTGMAGDGESLRAAILGRAAREECELTAQFDSTSFNALDYAALETTWASLGKDVQASGAFGMQGLIDDDLAFVAPWGFEVSDISVPVLVVQGGDDRVVPAGHGLWLSQNIHSSEQWMLPAEGHISVLNECAAALDWLLDRA